MCSFLGSTLRVPSLESLNRQTSARFVCCHCTADPLCDPRPLTGQAGHGLPGIDVAGLGLPLGA